jgi:predicted nucleic acid-binding protein
LWWQSLGDEEIVVPGFVVMELIEGCRNKAEQRKLEQSIREYQIIWPCSETCDKALTIFAEFRLSHGIGMIDALIGQMAVDRNLSLYTFNQKHYSVIPGLRTVQPYQRDPVKQ